MIGQTIGGYRILEQIGQGGMARVYKAYDPNLDHTVAVKVLPEMDTNDPKRSERFKQEARIIAKLEHARILPIYSFGEENGLTYLILRYIPTGTLADRIRERGPASLNLAAHIIEQVASALDYAHKQGVLHRDIKPSNILIDKEGDAYLTDFGVAKLVEASIDLTKTGGVLGTPAYMSPEQCTGAKELSPQSDQYALGVVLYELLTGRTPYQAETPLNLIQMHFREEPLPLPTLFRQEIPEETVRVILKALAREPEKRFNSCTEFAVSLRESLNRMTEESPEQSTDVTGEEISNEKTVDTYANTQLDGISDAHYEYGETVDENHPAILPSAIDDLRESSQSNEVLKGLESSSAQLTPQHKDGVRNLISKMDRSMVIVVVAATILITIALGINMSEKAQANQIAQARATQTAQARATQAAQARATQSVQTAATQTAQARATQTAQARATRTAQARATQTAQARASQTAEARLINQFNLPVRPGDMVFNEEDIRLPFEDDEFLTCYQTDISKKNFIIGMEFTVPYEVSSYGWDIGFLFRHINSNDQYRLFLYKGWGQGYLLSNVTRDNAGKPDFYNILNGWADINTEKGSTNQVVLVVNNDKGQLYINSEYIAELDLSYRLEAGGISLCTEFDSFDSHDGGSFVVDQLTIWNLN